MKNTFDGLNKIYYLPDRFKSINSEGKGQGPTDTTVASAKTIQSSKKRNNNMSDQYVYQRKGYRHKEYSRSGIQEVTEGSKKDEQLRMSLSLNEWRTDFKKNPVPSPYIRNSGGFNGTKLFLDLSPKPNRITDDHHSHFILSPVSNYRISKFTQNPKEGKIEQKVSTPNQYLQIPKKSRIHFERYGKNESNLLSNYSSKKSSIKNSRSLHKSHLHLPPSSFAIDLEEKKRHEKVKRPLDSSLSTR